MPPQSRGSDLTTAFHSKSTPNLPTLRTFDSSSTSDTLTPSTSHNPSRSIDRDHLSPSSLDSPSEPASITSSQPGSPLTRTISNSSSSSTSSNDPISSLPASRPFLHHQSRSHTYLAPPFYNRPPTPLPPSPSLTSLLRPTFTASRPTTPDPSSDEAGTRPPLSGTATPSSAAAGLTTSFRTARPVARASPKVPTYEYYGFTLYLTSSVVFLFYLLWSFFPSPILHQFGIYYYPNRWWSLAIPAWLVVLVVYVYVALAGYNIGFLTLGMGECEALVDEKGRVAVVDERGRIRRGWGEGSGNFGVGEAVRPKMQRGKGSRVASRRGSFEEEVGPLDWKTLWCEGTDAVMDVPIGGVCEVLYGEDRVEE